MTLDYSAKLFPQDPPKVLREEEPAPEDSSLILPKEGVPGNRRRCQRGVRRQKLRGQAPGPESALEH